MKGGYALGFCTFDEQGLRQDLSTTQPTYYETKQIHGFQRHLQRRQFDGIGQDPQCLVGRRVIWYVTGASATFHCKRIDVGFVSTNNCTKASLLSARPRSNCFFMDDVLRDALVRSVRNSRRILEAKIRRRLTDSGFCRVICIKCEGMQTMGFVYCKQERDGIATR